MNTLVRPDYARAKHKALELIASLDVSLPPVDPVAIADTIGLSVKFVTFPGDAARISGFYDYDEQAIFVNKEEFPLQQSFTIAHEVGHKVLHDEWARSSEYKILMRDGAADGDPIELEANAFAAHLLVPRFMLDIYWQRLSVSDLSRLFAVSVPVIKNRLSFEYGL